MKKKIEFCVPVLITITAFIGVYIARVAPSFFIEVLTHEDGLLEWLQVVALSLGMVVSLVRVVRLRKRKPPIFLLMTFGLALVFFFGAGEEISWGQRLFKIESTNYFASNNSQGETNFHNLMIDGVYINKLVFGKLLGVAIAFYLLILPMLYLKISKLKTIIDKFAVPIPRFHHFVVLLLVFIAAELTLSSKKGELIEFGGTWVFFLLTLNPYNKAIYE